MKQLRLNSIESSIFLDFKTELSRPLVKVNEDSWYEATEFGNLNK